MSTWTPDRIRALREQLASREGQRITQSEMGRRLGISGNYLGQLERGDELPGRQTTAALDLLAGNLRLRG